MTSGLRISSSRFAGTSWASLESELRLEPCPIVEFPTYSLPVAMHVTFLCLDRCCLMAVDGQVAVTPARLEDPAVRFYTAGGGSTPPRPVELSHGNMMSNVLAVGAHRQPWISPASRTFALSFTQTHNPYTHSVESART
eukprot:871161-Rhodomonas_salina.2